MIYRKWAVLLTATLVTCVVSIQGCGGDSGTDSTIGSGDGGDEIRDMDAASGDMDGTAGDGSGGDGSFSDTGATDTGATDGGRDAPTCGVAASTCAGNADCCLGNCDLTLHVCAAPLCKTAGTACVAANECCTFVCSSSGTCGATQCISDNQACTSNASCCGGVCNAATDGGAGTCTPLSGSCKTSGNACTANGDCCSSFCNGGFCSSTPSFCTQTGDVCSTNAECCGGICTKSVDAGAALGTCSLPSAPGGTQCTVTGQVCGAGADAGPSDGGVPPCGGSCCSRGCAPYGPTGVDICQVPSGCHPTGELCRSDNDCCGSASDPGGKTGGFVTCSKGSPLDPVGRCDNGGSCRAAGAVCKLATSSCNAENNCCAGNVNQDPTVCQQDNVGIPRCTGVGNCVDAGTKAGQVCSTSADCCGLACVPTNVTDGGAPFVCGGSCVQKAGGCTTNADCCPGLPCVLPPGGSSGLCGGSVTSDGGIIVTDAGTGGGGDGGTCALYGQMCTAAGQCCNGVPCLNGRCISP